uniref:Electron transfer flavoprotein-ubiquinone oxidoreductase n=1 Tax=Pyramimonas obovata TaxID=1411642 RepID=A0A7S0N8G8_9CHLO
MNVAKIKGAHTGMKSGMLAAECAFASLLRDPAHKYGTMQTRGPLDMGAYDAALRASWVGAELRAARNVRPAFQNGVALGVAVSALDQLIFRGRAPFTLTHSRKDHETLRPAKECSRIVYPKPDGEVSFDILTSLARSGVNHEHEQPCHLVLKDPKVAVAHTRDHYAAPETRYCPARVYEHILSVDGTPELHINAQNCLHCKACDIKDPKRNIDWHPPEGGGGPAYTLM